MSVTPGRALIVVDVQNDFCEGGALPVTGGNQVAGDLALLLAGEHGYDHVVATRDHHIDPGTHWSAEPDYHDSWPVHCEVGTPGVEFHPALDVGSFEAVFLKGEYEAAYSGFEGRTTTGDALADWLRERGVSAVEVCGLATDHCVLATALDARTAGFTVTVLSELAAGVAPDSTERALDELRRAGVDVG